MSDRSTEVRTPLSRATERRRVGRTDLSVTTIGLGSAPLAGLYQGVPRSQAIEVVRTALGAGLGYVDTAPHYGLGQAERILGEALESWGSPPPVISTKVGRLVRPVGPGVSQDDGGFALAPDHAGLGRLWDFSGAGIRASLAESLQRMNLPGVDIVYLHDPDDHEQEVYDSAYPALAEMRAEGSVKAIGAGMNQAAMLARLVARTDLDVVLLAGRYTLIDHSGLDELLPACVERSVSVVIGGVFNSGLLADPRPGATFDYKVAPPDKLGRALACKEVCERHGVPLEAAALQFPAAHPAVCSVLVGARSPQELGHDLRSFEMPIPAALWEELRAEGLIPEVAPTPLADPPAGR